MHKKLHGCPVALVEVWTPVWAKTRVRFIPRGLACFGVPTYDPKAQKPSATTRSASSILAHVTSQLRAERCPRSHLLGSRVGSHPSSISGSGELARCFILREGPLSLCAVALFDNVPCATRGCYRFVLETSGVNADILQRIPASSAGTTPEVSDHQRTF